MRRIVASLCASLLAVGLLAGQVLANGATYSDSRAGLTLEGQFINAEGTCGGYPMYLAGGTVEAVATISNDHIERPLGFSFNVEMYELTPAGVAGESLGIIFAYPIVPAGEQAQIPITFDVPATAEGPHELQVRLYSMPEAARPSGSSKAPPSVWFNMYFCASVT